jgi:hypothetical protein
MPTTFATTTFTVLVTINSYGALSPVDKSLLPPGVTSGVMWNVDQCNFARGKMERPEKYTCQVFTSAKSTAWTPEGETGAIAPWQENLQPDTNPEHRSDVAPPATPQEKSVAMADVGGSTTVVYPAFYQMVRAYNNTAVAADHRAGVISFFTEEECNAAVAQRPQPEMYYCLRYESAKTISHKFPAESQKQSPPPGPLPRPVAPERETYQKPAKPVAPVSRPQREAKARHRQQPQQQFDPVGTLVSLLTPQDW